MNADERLDRIAKGVMPAPDVQGYRPDLTAGWVVYLHRSGELPRARSYWYGPLNGWGRTWGWLENPEVKVWRTRALAEAAVRSRFGKLRTVRIIRLSEARSSVNLPT